MTNSQVLFILLVPTLHCNLRCEYCYVDHSLENLPEMSMEDWKYAYGWVRKYALFLGISKIRFLWFGGEPLCYGAERIHSSIAMQNQIFEESFCIRNKIQSNLTLVDSFVCDLISSSFGNAIGGSFEPFSQSRCFKNGSPATDIILEKISLLKQRKINVGIVSTLLKKNLVSAKDFYAFFKNNDLSFRVNQAHPPISCTATSDYLSTKEFCDYEISLFEEFVNDSNPTIDFANFTTIVKHILHNQKLSCNASPLPWLNISIEPSGRITNSCRQHRRIIGNYYENNVQAIFLSLRQKYTEMIQPRHCIKCNFFHTICAGPCVECSQFDCMSINCGYKTEYTAPAIAYVKKYLENNGVNNLRDAARLLQ